MITFKVGKLAEILGVHRNTITNLIKKGRLRARPTIGKRYLIKADDFRQFCIAQMIDPEIVRRLENEMGPVVSGKTTQQTRKREETMKNKPLGSALVVGGGIAGIQATLDLADAGFKVYMVEKSSGIGGVMAQLDKTFPTNDCAM